MTARARVIQPEYIQLEAGEDVSAIRDRLSFIRGRRVLLIWPERGTALTRKLDLVLVQREARRRVIQLALVTQDEDVIRHAKELNISTFPTIEDSDRQRWKRGRTKVFLPRQHKPEFEADPQELMTVASRVRSPRKRFSQVQFIIERTVLLLIFMGVIAAAAYVVLPQATVTFSVEQDIISADITITADPDPAVTDLDVSSATMPATVLRAPVQKVLSVETTGVRQFDDLPAVGSVVFTNNTNQPVSIPLDTVVSTSAGTPIRFKTVSSGTVPAGPGEQLTLNIEALPESSGSVGNVGAGLINNLVGDLAEQVSVINISPTTGGESRVRAVVTEDDLERLRLMVNGELQRIAFDEMRSQLTETQTIIEETLQIPPDGIRSDWINYSHQAGDITPTVSLDMRAVVEAIVIDDRFARQIVFASLSAQKPATLVLLPDTYIYSRGEVVNVDENNRVTFATSGEVVATAQINEEALRQELPGKSLDQVERIIAQRVPLMRGTDISVNVIPGWLQHMPLLPMRINIEIDNAS